MQTFEQELRKDPITKRWVIISSARSNRPGAMRKSEPLPDLFCPFDAGNEANTPKEMLIFKNNENDNDWWVRVVPNKFPALSTNMSLKKLGEGMYDKMSGYGYHEVVIETPEHNTTFGQMDIKQIREVLWSYIKRFQELRKDKNIKYIQIFKNCGKEAGATLQHPHSQIVATPIIPYAIIEEITGAETYYKFKDRCVFCDIINQELKENIRVVLRNENFIVLEPYAARFPYETWIMPIEHHHDFGTLDSMPEYVEELAEIMKQTYMLLEKKLDNPPYNMVIHTSPFIEGIHTFYHWHIEIIPRLTNIAGFEWGTGFYINAVPPESATTYLKGGE